MSRLNKRLKDNFSANAYAQIVNIIYQLAIVPFFLFFWTQDVYGEWLILSALPSYLALSNVGIMTVAHNKMTMFMLNNDAINAKKSLDTVWVAQMGIGMVAMLTVLCFLWWMDVTKVFNLTSIKRDTASITIIILFIYALVNQQIGIFGGVYRAIGKNAKGIFVINTVRLMSVVGIIVTLWLIDRSTISIALALLVTTIIGGIYIFYDTKKSNKTLTPGFSGFNIECLKEDIKLGIGFTAFPLGRALTNQGMLIVCNHFLGSGAVVILSVVRTVVNMVFQVSNMVSLSTWPEFSRLYVKGDAYRLKRLFIFSTSISTWLSVIFSTVIYILGSDLIKLWTAGKIGVEDGVLLLFLITMILNSCWHTASTTFNAINNHQKVAKCYFLCSILSLIFAYNIEVIFEFGLYSIAISLLIVEILMIFYVVPKALIFLDIKKQHWIREMLILPLKYVLKDKV
ncbi:lipopolysaccharide biosynthesis protein [Vibrio cortegadensis]|uniref:lipopolysaccharide biosynthesis protein n=1 Tax=Vibrio cortegadensis TaxID=1328770 RepID=UPI00352E052C